MKVAIVHPLPLFRDGLSAYLRRKKITVVRSVDQLTDVWKLGAGKFDVLIVSQLLFNPSIANFMQTNLYRGSLKVLVTGPLAHLGQLDWCISAGYSVVDEAKPRVDVLKALTAIEENRLWFDPDVIASAGFVGSTGLELVH